MAYIDNDKLKQIFYILIIVSLGYLLGSSLMNYLTAALGALSLYVLLRTPQHYLTKKRNWPAWISAIVLMILISAVIFVPGYFLGKAVVIRLMHMLENPQVLFEKADTVIKTIEAKSGYEIFSDNTLQSIQGWATKNVPNMVGDTFMGIMNFLFMYFILYFMLSKGKKMETVLGSYVPIKEENTLFVGRALRELVFSNSIVIPFLAIIQGLVAMLIYWSLGIKEFFFAGILTGVSSVIPVVGTMIVWVPAGAYLIALGHTWQGILLLALGGTVITNIDNVLRLFVQKKLADVHPLITIFGVIVGVKLFGFIGVIFGPILISLFLLLIELYKEEFVSANSFPVTYPPPYSHQSHTAPVEPYITMEENNGGEKSADSKEPPKE